MKLPYPLIWLLAVLAAGCTEEALTVDAPHFEGLDQAVVAEVIEHPVARQRIDEEPDGTRESMAQGIVRNFSVCRDALRVYQEWLATGLAPSLAPLPMPESPRDPSHSSWEWEWEKLAARVDSGEPDQLRFWLTAEGSCGQWIPARPGEPSGPTIKDVVEGRS